ncbi:hypothetical protein INR49_032617 [Caranx melampygus]|nr:hypothetical protein INR49_032617 [Caranx melampygus]
MHCWSSRFEHWRKPRGTPSSRQTTLLTAACTQTVKEARCPPLMAAPTPALNQSQMSRPTERSCVRSPVRLTLPPALQIDSLYPPAPTPLTCPRSVLPSYASPGDEVETV